jgi:hypothetical protein
LAYKLKLLRITPGQQSATPDGAVRSARGR